jgi:hypothetical protein
MNPLLLVYFAAGAVREVLVVSYYRSVSKKKDFAASGLAGGLELYDVAILAAIIGSGWSIPLIVAYTMGVMVGTFCGTRWCK